MIPKNKVTMKICIEPESMEKLVALSNATLAPVAALVRVAVSQYLESRKAELKKLGR